MVSSHNVKFRWRRAENKEQVTWWWHFFPTQEGWLGTIEDRRKAGEAAPLVAIALPFCYQYKVFARAKSSLFCVHWYSSMLKHDLSLVANNPKNNIYSARIRSNLCKLPGNLTNLNDLNIVTPIKSDKISHVDKFKNFFFRQTSEIGPPKWHTITVKFSTFIIVLMALARICPKWPTKISSFEVITWKRFDKNYHVQNIHATYEIVDGTHPHCRRFCAVLWSWRKSHRFSLIWPF